MNQESSKLVLDSAKSYIDYMEEKHTGWSKAFFRFNIDVNSDYGGTGSYVKNSRVELLGSLRDKEITVNLIGLLQKLSNSLNIENKPFVVCLLIIDSNF